MSGVEFSQWPAQLLPQVDCSDVKASAETVRFNMGKMAQCNVCGVAFENPMLLRRHAVYCRASTQPPDDDDDNDDNDLVSSLYAGSTSAAEREPTAPPPTALNPMLQRRQQKLTRSGNQIPQSGSAAASPSRPTTAVRLNEPFESQQCGVSVTAQIGDALNLTDAEHVENLTRRVRELECLVGKDTKHTGSSAEGHNDPQVVAPSPSNEVDVLAEARAAIQRSRIERSRITRESCLTSPLHPSSPRTTAAEFKEKGNAAFAAGNFTEAEEMFSQAIAADHTQEAYFANRSSARLALGNHQEALSDCEICLDLSEQRNVKAWYRKGKALQLLNRPDDARVAFEAGLKILPSCSQLKEAFERLEPSDKQVEDERRQQRQQEQERRQAESIESMSTEEIYCELEMHRRCMATEGQHPADCLGVAVNSQVKAPAAPASQLQSSSPSESSRANSDNGEEEEERGENKEGDSDLELEEWMEYEELSRLAKEAAGDSDDAEDEAVPPGEQLQEGSALVEPVSTAPESVTETPMARRRKAAPPIMVDVVVASMGRKNKCSFEVNMYSEVSAVLQQMDIRPDSAPVSSYRVICNRRSVGLHETFRSIVPEGCTRAKMLVVEAGESSSMPPARFCLTVRSLKDYSGTFRVKPTDSVRALKKRVLANANSWGVGANSEWTLHLPGLPMLHYEHELKDYGESVSGEGYMRCVRQEYPKLTWSIFCRHRTLRHLSGYTKSSQRRYVHLIPCHNLIGGCCRGHSISRKH